MYIYKQAIFQGFWVKIVNILSFFCLSILKRDLDTKKTTPNIEVYPESHVGILIYIEHRLLERKFETVTLGVYYSSNKFGYKTAIFWTFCLNILVHIFGWSFHYSWYRPLQNSAPFILHLSYSPFPVFYQWNKISKKTILFGHPHWFCPLKW